MLLPLHFCAELIYDLLNHKDIEIRVNSTLIFLSLVFAVSYAFSYGLPYWLINFLQVDVFWQICLYSIAYLLIWVIGFYLLACVLMGALISLAFLDLKEVS
jgi:hypothetical protein